MKNKNPAPSAGQSETHAEAVALRDIVFGMVEEMRCPSEIIELFYMTREPELRRLCCTIAGLEPDERGEIASAVEAIMRRRDLAMHLADAAA